MNSNALVNFDSIHHNGELTMMDLARRCATEADAWELLEDLRWGCNVECAHCGSADVRDAPPSG